MNRTYNVRINFTRSGWRQFGRMNHGLGARFIRGYILRRELAAYIKAHEESGAHLDTVCQELRYEGGVYLLLMKCQGIWYVTDIWSTEMPDRFVPVFLWKRIKRGWRELLVRVVVTWCNLTGAWESGVLT